MIIQTLRINENNIIKIFKLPKETYRFKDMIIHILWMFFKQMEKKNSKLQMKILKTQIVKKILNNKNKASGIRVLEFKKYFRNAIINI